MFKCTIQIHIINFQPFLTSFVIFMHLLNILSYKTLKLKSISNELWKGWKLAWYHNFTPHSMCKKVERLTAQIGCTSCTKRTISFEVSGFHTETRLLQRDFIFWSYLNSIVFLRSKCTIQIHIINLQPLSDFICYFSCIYWLFSPIIPWNRKVFEMNF